MAPLGPGRTQTIDGVVYYSPNATYDTALILHEPADANPFIPENPRKVSYVDFLHARRWNRANGWLAFVPRRAWYSQNCGPLIGRLSQLPTGMELWDHSNRFLVGHRLYNAQPWLALENELMTAIVTLKNRWKLPIIIPHLPNVYGFSKGFRSRGALYDVVERSRDWFLVVFGLLSYLLACARTLSRQTDAQSLRFPFWRSVLENAGLSANWVDDLFNSPAMVYDARNPRVGCILTLLQPDPDQPSVDWFLDHGIPVWYAWGPNEDARAKRDPDFARLRPPPAEHLPFPLSAPLPTPPIPEAIIAWTERRDIENNLAKLCETPEQKEAREQRASNPPLDSPVFVWREDGMDPRLLHRIPVDRKARFETLLSFSPEQRRYNDYSNEWDCSTYFSTTIPPPLEDKLQEESIPDMLQEEAIPDEVVSTLHPHTDIPDSFPPSSSEDSWEEPPSNLDLSSRIQEYMKLFYGMHLPLPDAPIPSTHSEPKDRDIVLKHLLGAELRRPEFGADRQSYINSPGHLLVTSFFNSVQGGSGGSGMWDIASSSHESVRLTSRFRSFRKIQIETSKTPELQELCNKHCTHYFVLDLPNPTVPWRFATLSARAALLVCRLPAEYNEREVMLYCAQLGIPFRIFNPNPPQPSPCPLWVSNLSKPIRPYNHKFTREDYDGYVRQRTMLLGLPHMQAAIKRGGIVWRLAIRVLGLTGVSLPAMATGEESAIALGGQDYVDNLLASEEMDLICGGYRCISEDGKEKLVSWWPLARYFEKEGNGCNFGHWSSAWEHWFQERLKQIEGGNAQPLPYLVWAKHQDLRGLGRVRDFMKRVELEASSLFE